MAASTDGTWTCLTPTDETLHGVGFEVKARTHSRADELWVRIETPDGCWRYVVIGRDGELLATEASPDKRAAFLAALEARTELTAD